MAGDLIQVSCSIIKLSLLYNLNKIIAFILTDKLRTLRKGREFEMVWDQIIAEARGM